ncbi:MAG: hypothetical protein ABR923_14620 [Terracidiphilus sp.]|jgi:hypothetical protein
MKLFGLRVQGFAKALVILASIFWVALGLCGMSGSIESKHGWNWIGPNPIPNTPLGTALSTVDWVSLAAMTISAAGIGISLILWAIVVIYRLVFGPKNDRVGG